MFESSTINKDKIKDDVNEAVVESVYREWQDRGFPYYPTDYEWRLKRFNDLLKFDRSGLYKPEEKIVGSSAHGLSLA